MERRFLVGSIPKGGIPYPCYCVEKLRGKKYAWKRKEFAGFAHRAPAEAPVHPYAQFALAWVSLSPLYNTLLVSLLPRIAVEQHRRISSPLSRRVASAYLIRLMRFLRCS